MMHKPGQFALLVCSLLAGVMLCGGCSSSVDHARGFTFAAGDYPEAFASTRSVLREYRFDIERVDADSGVITTLPEFSPGLLQPWSPLQTGFGDEWEDTVNRQAREVRVTFEPEAGEEGMMRASVWVTVLRQHRAGRRLDSEWVGGSTFTVDPLLQERHTLTYNVPVRRDESLEARLAKRIEEEMRRRAETSATVAAEGAEES